MSIILNILQYPDQGLRGKCEPVEKFDEMLHKTVSVMFDTLESRKGSGLAAPQVGIKKRIAVVNYGQKYVLINPVILSTGETESEMEEACLSFSGMNFTKVRRPDSLEVEAQNEDGGKFTIRADGVLAKIFHHEIEHLDGILLIDHLSRLKREMLDKKMRKLMRKRTRKY